MTNTTTAHTPGPWRLDGSIGTINLDVVYAYGRIAMLECENDEISDDQLMANARLIAAAPDMLAALKAIAGAEEMHGDSFVCDFHTLQSIARHAIRKTGA